MENQNHPNDQTGLDNYYQEEFRKIRDSNESYKGKWNWWAFIFAGIWGLFKGSGSLHFYHLSQSHLLFINMK